MQDASAEVAVASAVLLNRVALRLSMIWSTKHNLFISAQITLNAYRQSLEKL